MRAARTWVEPRQREANASLNLRLPASVVAELDAYAEYVGGESDRRYVAHQILTAFLARDRDFREWLESRAHGSGSSGATPTGAPRP